MGEHVFTIRDELAASPFGFTLCGSRALGNETAESDWDYYAEYSHQAAEFLISRGFFQIEHDEYEDAPHVVSIFEKIDDTGAKVQVALEFDRVFRERIMRALRENESLRALDISLKDDPAERDALWSAFYAMAGFNADDFDDFTKERVKP